MDRKNRRVMLAVRRDLPDHKFQCAGRERGRGQRHDDQIRCAQHLGADLVQYWRTVEQNAIVVRSETFRQLGKAATFADLQELGVERPQAFVGG